MSVGYDKLLFHGLFFKYCRALCTLRKNYFLASNHDQFVRYILRSKQTVVILRNIYTCIYNKDSPSVCQPSVRLVTTTRSSPGVAATVHRYAFSDDAIEVSVAERCAWDT